MKFLILLCGSLAFADPREYLVVPVLHPLDGIVSTQVVVLRGVPAGAHVGTPLGEGAWYWWGPGPPEDAF